MCLQSSADVTPLCGLLLWTSPSMHTVGGLSLQTWWVGDLHCHAVMACRRHHAGWLWGSAPRLGCCLGAVVQGVDQETHQCSTPRCLLVIAQLRLIGLLPVRPYGCRRGRRGMLALSKRCGCEPVYNNNMSNVSMRVKCLPWVMLAAHASHCVLTKAEALCCATVLCRGTGRGREAFLLLGVDWWSVGGVQRL